ncbi:hypothetical protein L1785_02960 [Antribacter sp. KLBMP9083]|uniref:Cell wall-binding repeat-containing protein n=1 Tax=Antribacter soli TaxID=2910976 RepID=A0AA41QBV6_9MICO|nr:hypothetical protein [Antribacter soli]MCF4119930.1 hypothetical protein [Antribacter soli]
MDLRNARFLLKSVALSATVLVAGLLVLGGCAVGTAEGTAPVAQEVRVNDLPTHTVVLDSEDPAELALTASQMFFEASRVAVLADAADGSARATAAAVSVAIAAPALLSGGGISGRGLAGELRRLGTETLVVVGDGAEAAANEVAGNAGATVVVFEGESLEAVAEAATGVTEAGGPASGNADPAAAPLPDPAQLDAGDLADLRAQLPDRGEPELLTEVLALVDPQPGQEAAIGTVTAAGAVPFRVAGGDPGASAEAVDMLADAKALGVVAVGAGFGSAEDFGWRVAAAETGHMLPTGSQRLFPARYVATPYTVPLRGDGAAAESPDETVALAGENAAPFTSPDPAAPVVAAIELAAAVRSPSAGADGDYVTEQPAAALQPAIDAARAAGRLVLLDVAPGNRPLVEEVKELETLLAQPGVGVVLHPEQRRAGNGARSAGVVDVSEVQAVVDYLSGVVAENALPQSMLVVYQSTASSVVNRAGLTSTAQVATVFLAARGTAGLATTPATWSDVTTGLPDGVRLGWAAPSSLPDDAVSLLPAEPAAPDLVAVP